MQEQEAQVRRIVKVAIICMALAIAIAIAQAALAQSSEVGEPPTLGPRYHIWISILSK